MTYIVLLLPIACLLLFLALRPWMKPKHTLASVVVTLERGLRDGSIVLDGEHDKGEDA